MHAVHGYDSLRHGSKSDLFSNCTTSYIIFLQFVLLWSHGAILLKHSPCMMGHGVIVFSASGCCLPVVDAALPITSAVEVRLDEPLWTSLPAPEEVAMEMMSYCVQLDCLILSIMQSVRLLLC